MLHIPLLVRACIKNFGRNSPVIKCSSINIQTYTRERLEILGKIKVHFVHKEQAQCIILIIKRDKPNFIGQNWLGKMHLDWNEIHHLQATSGIDNIVQKRAVVFKDKLGVLEGMKFSLHMDQNAHP